MSASQDFVALDWIKGEIASTLDQAQQALEAVAESPDDSSSMRACLTRLHQVNGTLRMVNLEGPSALSAEMEELAESLMGNEVPDVSQAQEVLMQAILQMPRYLDRIQREQRDDPAMVRPVVNSLRRARGEAPLGGESEAGDDGGDRLSPLTQAPVPEVISAFQSQGGTDTVRKLRARYQQALAALLRKESPRENLTLMAKVFSMLQKITGDSPTGNMALLGLATVEGVAAGAIKLNGTIAGALRGVDAELKSFVEAGDDGLSRSIDPELGATLLDAIDGASKETPRILVAKGKFRAAAPALVDESEDVSFGPDDETIAAVARILIEELNGITDKLDLYVRSSDRNTQSLFELVPQLEQINGTLAVVGLNQHMDSVSTQAQVIRGLQESGESPDDELLLDIAGALLEIESSLKSLVGDEDEGEGEGFGSVTTAEATVIRETRNGLASCKDAVIEYVTADFDRSKVEGLPESLTSLRGGLRIINQDRSAAVLEACAAYASRRLLGGDVTPSLADMDDLADAITSIDYYLERYLESPGDPYLQMVEVAEQAITKLGFEPGNLPAADAPDEAAVSLDATVELDAGEAIEEDPAEQAAEPSLDESIGVEAMPDSGSEDVAESAPDAADFELEDMALEPVEAPEPETPADKHEDAADELAAADEDFAPTDVATEDATEEALAEEAPAEEAPADQSAPEEMTLEDIAFEADDEAEPALDPITIGPDVETGEPASSEPAAAPQSTVEEVDDEILEIFIEEAAEVLETINEYLPQWQANTEDADALTEVRRAYHTLKGSGRMVGATVVGELAWSVENMLNRVIDGTIEAGPEVLALVGDVTARIPEGVEAFRVGDQHAFDGSDLEARAEALSRGESVVAAPAEETPASFDSDEFDEIETVEATPEEVPPVEDLELDEISFDEDEPEAALVPESPAEDIELEEISFEDESLADEAEPSAYEEPSADEEPSAHEEPPAAEDLAAHGDLSDEEIPAEAASPAAEPSLEAAVDDHDAELDDIFLAEAEERLQVVRAFVADPAEVGADLVAAFHTLKGSAGMAEVATVSAIGARLETLSRQFYERGGSPTEGFVSIVARGATFMDEILADLDRYRASHPDLNSYLIQIDGLSRADGGDSDTPRFDFENVRLLSTADAVLDAWDSAEVSSLMQELREVIAQADNIGAVGLSALSTSLLGVYERLDTRPTETIAAQLAQAHEHLVAMFDAIAASQDVPEPGDLPAELDHLDVTPVAPEAEAAEPAEPQPAAPQPATPPAAAPSQARELPADEIDEDVLPLFLEEAEELVEEIDESIVAWSSNPSATEHLDNLLRQLHTLKGGSRMSGLASLGEYTHNFETFLIGVQHQDPGDFDEAFFALVNERQDEINRRVEIYRAMAAGTASDADIESMRYDAPVGADARQTTVPAPETTAEPVEEASIETVAPDQLETDADAPAATSIRMEASSEAVALPEDDVDEDVLPIFLEEAEEIVEEIDQSILDWSNQPDASEHLDNLLRQLHTLKGGSRMAGLASLGEFTHNLETWLIGVQQNPPALDEAFFGQLNQQQDEINRRVGIYRKLAGGEATDDELASMRSAAQPGTVAAAALPAAEGSSPGAAPEAEAEPSAEVATPEPKAPAAQQQEMVRVSSDLLEELISLAGESSITRGRVEQQISDFGESLQEMEETINRIREQVRRLEIEAESRETVFRSRSGDSDDGSFDDLELDRYTMIQEISRALNEGMSDMLDLRDTLVDKSRDAETLLHQQARIGSELQEGLTRTRMVPFARLIPRLRRIVRQVSAEVGKSVRFDAYNVEGELDRTVLERIVAPLEHMLRNAVDHGIESTDKRVEAGKSEQGHISLRLDRDGGYVVLKISDDGGGINVDAVKTKAIERGLMTPDQQLSDHEIRQFIMQAGFSTAQKLTQISGRGVGMDVVVSEIKALGGEVEIDSTYGVGTEFTIRLPFTVSINRALMVVIQDEVFAIPLNTIEGIVRVSPYELEAYYQPDAPMFEYAGQPYRLSYMGTLLDKGGEPVLEGQVSPLPVILARSGDNAVALQVDRVIGSREVVVKSLGPQFNEVGGVSGATVLGDGSVVIILDVMALVRSAELAAAAATEAESDAPMAVDSGVRTVLIVDDSVTVRKVTSRLMERQGWEVTTAKDGLDAMNQLQDMMPDIVLLDIEMPKMDGFEVLSAVRRDERLKDLPIIMITSRTGEKHQQRALDLGVNRYLGKPFQEANLMSTIDEVLKEVRG